VVCPSITTGTEPDRKQADAHIATVRIPFPWEELMPQRLKALEPYKDADAYIGSRVRTHRIAAGWSQAALGERSLLSKSLVHMIETGERPLQDDQADRLDKQLGTHGELAALAELRRRGLLWTQEGNMDASRRTFLHGLAGLPAIAAADRIGHGMQSVLNKGLPAAGVDHWQQVVAGHTARYLSTAPDQLLADLIPDLAAIHDFTAAHPYQKDLASIAARLAGLTGALLTDLGRPGQARHWLLLLDGYAEQAGDTHTRAWGWAATAILDTYYATPDQVTKITSRAIPAAGTTACGGTVMLHGLHGRALAALGDRDGAITALAAAASIHSSLSAADADDYMWGFPERQLRWYESRTYTATKDLNRAAQSRAEALRLYPADDQVDRVLLRFDEATCAAASNEPDRAASVAAQAMSDVPADRRTTVVSRRAAELAATLTPYRRLESVRLLEDVRASWMP